MDNVNPLGFLRSSIYLIVIILILLGGVLTLSLIRLGRQEAAQPEPTEIPFVVCNFTNTGADPVPLYSAPYDAPSLVIDSVPPGVPYAVQAVNNGFLRIKLRENYDGYVDQFRGVSTGDCGRVPTEERSVLDFPTVCRFTTTREATLYADAARTEVQRSLPVDTGLVVLREVESAYQVGLLSGLTGWLAAADGTLEGACGTLPGPGA